MEAEQRYSAVVHQMHGAEAEYKEVLTQYDLEFEEKGQQMSEKLHKVHRLYNMSRIIWINASDCCWPPAWTVVLQLNMT